ncbi:5'/3'-nucleotidase SurE [Halorubrum sp. JWXQ-INN 858]|uniref:5'/3'-nucleotidase SurE n=1 Tax=Halorubrum sp. JWXQ-INN 858 TaxID=2690782 RepID=UPI001357807B|nr:5'/3'-nucleotidase SurE [Halorubrum sp. JWXQ-INN 858]MWV64292.1 5'/3'-nucleotidase SurE [Halorubrum sp. JWXQ-INN 858]
MSVERILLTNDDGIDAVGLRALYDALADDYAVTVVAPADDQSSIGRALSHGVDVVGHELGYVVDGTPADCVVAGLGELVPDADCVVAGCNKGANLGAYVLGRSGTVSAAVEAAFFDVPAIAASMYVPGDGDWWRTELDAEAFAHATRATRHLVDGAVDAGVFETADYLNLNAPIARATDARNDGGVDAEADGAEADGTGADGRKTNGEDLADGARAGDAPAPLRVTVPSTWYGMDAERNGDGGVTFTDPIWGRMTSEEVPDDVGVDRRAVVDGEVSVSPLTALHTAEPHEALDGLVASYVE